jgi:hypothetical protein
VCRFKISLVNSGPTYPGAVAEAEADANGGEVPHDRDKGRLYGELPRANREAPI